MGGGCGQECPEEQPYEGPPGCLPLGCKMSYTNTRWKIAGQIPRLQKTLHATNSDG